MRTLFDTTLLINGAAERRGHHDTATRLPAHAERGAVDGRVAPASITTCWYVSTAPYGVAPRPLFEYLSTVFDRARMGWPALSEALEAPAEADFEDKYIAAAGGQAGAEVVVTRNAGGFRDGPLTAYHPEEGLGALG